MIVWLILLVLLAVCAMHALPRGPPSPKLRRAEKLHQPSSLRCVVSVQGNEVRPEVIRSLLELAVSPDKVYVHTTSKTSHSFTHPRVSIRPETTVADVIDTERDPNTIILVASPVVHSNGHFDELVDKVKAHPNVLWGYAGYKIDGQDFVVEDESLDTVDVVDVAQGAAFRVGTLATDLDRSVSPSVWLSLTAARAKYARGVTPNHKEHNSEPLDDTELERFGPELERRRRIGLGTK